MGTEMKAPLFEVRGLQMRFGDTLIQEAVSFKVEPRTIFAIMGVSGCGKSTLLRHMIGLQPPAGGQVLYGGADYWAGDAAAQARLRSSCGMLFQSAALWSSMTVLENVCMPLVQLGQLDRSQREARALEVMGWVGMGEFGAYLPADLSGGMKKRVGLARAIAASPQRLLLDEPSAGLDPIASRRLDDLILDIRNRTGAAVVFVSHELPSLLGIADDGIFLDIDTKRPLAHGSPRQLLEQCQHPTVRAFLHREEPPAQAAVAPVAAAAAPAALHPQTP